ncbi:energy-coupling factor transporter transmembrane component T [Mesobacillus subterraneus]|uniref:energy-coupling factor transporter transmembrane component T family protein n=1 Tax=Mesobacillus subterraneus TaxID=285983 RepID=UPI001CFCE216|nr:energy-coupling factor transporter transmembrane component T [Mesobacillus subterraneus]WLR56844.1 energy-coupling factor transporter transmembrane component T [Mesobacillus subterraneus]
MLLNEMNPSIKALSILVSILLLSIFFDPVTPLLSLILTIAITFIFGKIHFKKWILLFSPFLFMAIVYVWSSLLFPRVDWGDSIIWEWWFITITAEGVQRSISLGLRVLSFASLSLLFALTTNPFNFLLSLMQQCKLSPKIAYSIMAGYQFLPMIKNEFEIIRSAHRIRGAGRTETLSDKIKQIKKYGIPLLASGIRKAERTAIAMESKGFTGDKEREFYRVIPVSKRDWLLFGLLICIVLVSALTSHKLGYLSLYNGEL